MARPRETATAARSAGKDLATRIVDALDTARCAAPGCGRLAVVLYRTRTVGALALCHGHRDDRRVLRACEERARHVRLVGHGEASHHHTPPAPRGRG